MAEEQKSTNNLDKELSNLYQPKAVPTKGPAAKRAPRAKKAATGVGKKKLLITKGKRKRAIARASLRQGKGVIRFNGVDISLMQPRYMRDLILEPVKVTSVAKGVVEGADIDINVYGGGRSGQAQAARSALAKAIVGASSSPDALRKVYMDYDRTLLVDDYRRVEPKKFKGPKARARFQKSYR
jgi:small subunit ribosomal protein S9